MLNFGEKFRDRAVLRNLPLFATLLGFLKLALESVFFFYH